MKRRWLLLTAALAVPAWTAPAPTAQAAFLAGAPDPAGNILARDRLRLLSAVRYWQDYLAAARPQARERYLPELAWIQAAARGARTIEEFRPVELRLDAWEKTLRAEILPSLPAGASGSVALAQAQVEAFQAVEKLQRTALSPESRRFLEGINSRISLACDAGSLSRLFDRAGLSRPAPLPAAVFYPGASAFAAPAPAPAKGLNIREVPAPDALTADNRVRFARVAEALRRRGASRKLVDLAIRQALEQHADPLLVLSVIQNESGFDPRATSRSGARGLMQIMPKTGKGLGVRDPDQLYNPETNIRAGVRYLKGLWDTFADFSFTSLSWIDPFSDGGVKKVVASYNAGPGAVKRYGAVPPYRETRRYVLKVLRTYLELRDLFRGGDQLS